MWLQWNLLHVHYSGPSTWKAASRLGLKWLGWGGGIYSTPHDLHMARLCSDLMDIASPIQEQRHLFLFFLYETCLLSTWQSYFSILWLSIAINKICESRQTKGCPLRSYKMFWNSACDFLKCYGPTPTLRHCSLTKVGCNAWNNSRQGMYYCTSVL